MAPGGMFDVSGDEPRSASTWRALCSDVKPELRGSTGTRRPHTSDEPCDGRSRSGHRTINGCARRDVDTPQATWKQFVCDLPQACDQNFNYFECGAEQLAPHYF